MFYLDAFQLIAVFRAAVSISAVGKYGVSVYIFRTVITRRVPILFRGRFRAFKDFSGESFRWPVFFLARKRFFFSISPRLVTRYSRFSIRFDSTAVSGLIGPKASSNQVPLMTTNPTTTTTTTTTTTPTSNDFSLFCFLCCALSRNQSTATAAISRSVVATEFHDSIKLSVVYRVCGSHSSFFFCFLLFSIIVPLHQTSHRPAFGRSPLPRTSGGDGLDRRDFWAAVETCPFEIDGTTRVDCRSACSHCRSGP